MLDSILFFPRLQIRVGGVGCAQSHKLGNPPHWQNGFLADSCRHRQFFRVALSPLLQILFRPFAAFQTRVLTVLHGWRLWNLKTRERNRRQYG